MASFPTTIVTPTDPTGGSLVTNPDHAQEHQSHNAEIVALETKIGTGAATPTSGKVLRSSGTGTSTWGQVVLSTDVASATSADLRSVLSDETGTGSAVFGTTPAITSPAITTPNITTSINDANGNEVIKTPATGSAVNEVTITNAATGVSPLISATGNDANADLKLQPKGTTGILQMLDGNGNEVIKTGVATASAVNEVTVTNAATNNAPVIEVTGGDANAHIVVRGKGNGLTKVSVLRQDDTTNTYKHNSVILTGWGVKVPGATNASSETVTFGVTFAQRPIVVMSYGGDLTAGTLTYGSGVVAENNSATWAHTITTTSFIARVQTVSGNWTATASVFYQWIAIGELT